MPDAPDTIRLHEADNVLVCLRDLGAGSVTEGGIALTGSVPRGHKIAADEIAEGAPVYRCGHVIGRATRPIARGEHVHVQNLGMSDHPEGETAASGPLVPFRAAGERTFQGYHRADGRVGTRNYLGIVTTVNCSGSVARFIAEAAEREGLLDAFPHVDGIVPVVHGTGCGMSKTDEGYQTLFRTLSGYVTHPNFGAVMMIGLGCEVMQLSALTQGRKITPDGPVRYMTIQNEGGTRATVEKGLAELREMAALANEARRATASAAHLSLGMQCGGSDGYSGITANPVLGHASDLLVAQGGASLLSETPEIYGAEDLLLRRAVTPDVADKLRERLSWWEDYCARNGGEMDNNPSPGNKRGGLTTILEKSLGAVAKGGTAPLSDVIAYAEPIGERGLVFMDSHGFDPCSITGQVASGANIVVFTTGRGSVSGFKPSPCIKIATNTDMYRRMNEDMDMNCGDVADGTASIAEKGEALFDLMLSVASGEQSKSERQGFGGGEFVPWQIGAVM